MWGVPNVRPPPRRQKPVRHQKHFAGLLQLVLQSGAFDFDLEAFQTHRPQHVRTAI